MTQPYRPDEPDPYDQTQIGAPSSAGYQYGSQPGYPQPGYTPLGYPQPGYQPPPPSRGPQILAAAAAVVALIAVGAVIFLFLRSGDDTDPVSPAPAGTEAAAGEQHGQTPPGDRGSAPGEQEQEDQQQPQQPQEPQQPQQPGTAGGPVGVTGADRQGFASGPRCNAAGDDAVFVGRTERSRVVICQVGSQTGRYYYKGLAGGNSIEVGYPTRSGSQFTATNKGVSYIVSPSSLTITENGAVLTREPMLQAWVD